MGLARCFGLPQHDIVGGCVLLAVLSATTSTLAASAAATQASQRVQNYFEQLADSDPAKRDEARTALMGLRRDQLATLRHIVESNQPLAPAQAAALREIVIHVFLAGDPYRQNIRSGFLGAMLREEEMAPLATTPDEAAPVPPKDGVVGVVITEAIEGFCANRFLRAGDIILGVIGSDFYPTPQSGDLTLRVQDVSPGDPITLQILRQGKVIRVTFKVDARPFAAESGEMTEFRNERMERAREYWHRVFEPAVDPVTVPVKAITPSNPLADT